MRRYPIVEIEDVQEPFCGVRRKNLETLFDARPDVADEWLYSKNAGWGPEHFSKGSGVRCWWQCSDCLREYKAQINNRTNRNSACPYCASKRVCSDNSLADIFPQVAVEWHAKKNGKLTPVDVMYASGKKAWWQCRSCKHEWEATISDRTTLGAGCPACYEARMQYAREHPKPYVRKRIVLSEKQQEISRAWYEKPSNEDFVCLMQSHFSIAKQWHPTKNGKWTPYDFSAGSDAIVWWKCKKGPDHEWQAPIYSRTGRKSHCPFCIGRRVSVTNSVKTKMPKLAKEWHPTLNGKLRPEHVTCGSGKKVWWRCMRYPEHVWQTTVHLRSGGSGCPDCAHQRVSPLNSLKAQFPYISVQLHPTKNGGLKGDQIAASSSKKVWWFCKKGPDHEWEATPANRTGRGSGCPFCVGKKVSITNSLQGLFPHAAKQWDKKKNGKLTPSQVSGASSLAVYWRCKKGHSWQQSICKRVKSPVDCWECGREISAR